MNALDRQVLDILHTGKVNYWTGPVGMEFERTFAKALRFRNAVSVLSGVAARRVAYLSLGLDPDAKEGPPCRRGVRRGLAMSRIGTVAFFAFGPDAPITAGGQGGMVCTDDDELAWEMRSIRDHGYDARHRMQTSTSTSTSNPNLSVNPYVHRRLGYNFRLTEIQSAIALAELKRLIDKRV